MVGEGFSVLLGFCVFFEVGCWEVFNGICGVLESSLWVYLE